MICAEGDAALLSETAAPELFAFFSQDVFVRNGLYHISLKGSSELHSSHSSFSQSNSSHC
jgi:hypothetical protein